MSDPALIIVTSGYSFTDVDAVACAISYAELLRHEGKASEVVLPGPLNNTVTDEIRAWIPDYDTQPENREAQYVVVDVSEPPQIAKFVDQARIIEIYDHHFGTDAYWRAKIGDKAVIEPVGACATLICEQIFRRRFEDQLSLDSARLLHAAIISNSQNLVAQITKERDHQAAEKLKRRTGFDEAWVAKYYSDQETSLFLDVETAIIADTKRQMVQALGHDIVIGQIELWDGRDFVNQNRDIIAKTLENFGNPDWFMNVLSISQGQNFLLASNHKMEQLLKGAIGADFNGGIGHSGKLWLRKEILREIARTS